LGLLFGAASFGLAHPALEIGGGPSFSWLAESGPFVGKSQGRFVFNADLGLELPIADGLSVVPSAAWVVRGDRLRREASAEAPAAINSSVRVTYLQFPVLLRAQFPAGPVRIELFLGPSLGLPLTASMHLHLMSPPGNEYPESELDQKITDWARPEFAMRSGLGARFPMGRVSAFARLTYHHGWTDVFEADVPWGGRERFGRNRALDLSLGLNLPL